MELISRQDAKTRGEKHFFTGKACNHGHIVPRFSSDGTCTECRRLKSKEWYSDREYAAAKARCWRAKNKDKERQSRKARRLENIEIVREKERFRAAENRQAMRKSCREWYHRNKDREQSRSLAYRNSNLEESRKKSREWNNKNPQQVAANARTRRARERGNGGAHTAEDVLDILKMQRERCAICRLKLGTKYHVDHIVPLAAGGSNERRNLQIACIPCNKSKSARDPITFMQMRGMLL